MDPIQNGNDKTNMSPNARMAIIITCVVLVIMVGVALAIVAKRVPEKAAALSGESVTADTAPAEADESTPEENASDTTGQTPAYTSEYSEEAFDRDDSDLDLDDVYDWYVGQIWNPITDFDEFIKSGKNSAGQDFDAQAEFDDYVDAIEHIDEYTDYIHEYHPAIKENWDKMMEQVKTINATLDLGFDVGTEKIDTTTLATLNEDFFKYANENRYR